MKKVYACLAVSALSGILFYTLAAIYAGVIGVIIGVVIMSIPISLYVFLKVSGR